MVVTHALPMLLQPVSFWLCGSARECGMRACVCVVCGVVMLRAKKGNYNMVSCSSQRG